MVIFVVVFNFQKRPENQNFQKPQPKPYSQERENNCPYLKEYALTVSAQVSATFIIELWKKGYHWSDIRKLWDWRIDQTDIPDRTKEKRIGIIKFLGVLERNPSPGIWTSEGTCNDLVIIISRISESGSKINVDGSIKPDSSTTKYVTKLIKWILEQEKVNPVNYQISLLLPRGAENTGKELETGYSTAGKSFGSAIYLALLSALHKKSISQQVAATGYLITKPKKGVYQNREIELAPGTNAPIGGLEAKVSAAVREKVNRLVLSKYNSSPHLLRVKKTLFFSFFGELLGINDDYQQIQSQIKEQVKEIFWTQNSFELRDLVFSNKLN
ncbi:MAG: hypothetical protein I3270_01050 [Candidatus Moeniiplasma glomeromycotorum]|nr:hypothetical protein [Candidatus Moeniiplasma glomeromycotorum]MCE8162299.1 hypothetical protein [Candidatus Moeniiplasma glomeromycotorum]MCE8166223.1 hypothetical protein [Candidatus Moeniiplasma glomeromycotorum]MCE8166705.1 hypothetical protein [Candidatus Moeniiplasma glomeromycotorum]